MLYQNISNNVHRSQLSFLGIEEGRAPAHTVSLYKYIYKYIHEPWSTCEDWCLSSETSEEGSGDVKWFNNMLSSVYKTSIFSSFE